MRAHLHVQAQNNVRAARERVRYLLPRDAFVLLIYESVFEQRIFGNPPLKLGLADEMVINAIALAVPHWPALNLSSKFPVTRNRGTLADCRQQLPEQMRV